MNISPGPGADTSVAEDQPEAAAPSEPGLYLDRVGDLWHLDADRGWTNSRGAPWGHDYFGEVAVFGPFTSTRLSATRKILTAAEGCLHLVIDFLTGPLQRVSRRTATWVDTWRGSLLPKLDRALADTDPPTSKECHGKS